MMSTKQARPIYFLADPFSGQRVRIGAMVRDDNGVRFEPVRLWEPLVPGIGSTRQRRIALVRIVLEDLRGWRRMDELPISVGPQVEFGEATG